MNEPTKPLSLAVLGARSRMPLLCGGIGLVIVTMFLDSTAVAVLGWVMFVLGLAFYFRLGIVRRDPVRIASPVAGRWRAINSPADHVPSHGLQAYGQTYAIDVVYEPGDRPRPGFGWWPLARRADEFPGFGEPVFAPVDGVVVRAHDRERDHWSRTSWPSLLLLLLESVREFFGPSKILGNHVVVDCGDGTYVALAHLKRRSVRVAKGQRVTAGEQVGACGNSGNSSEPHLHFQLMDHPNLMVAAGLPFEIDFEVEGKPDRGVPHKGLFLAQPA